MFNRNARTSLSVRSSAFFSLGMAATLAISSAAGLATAAEQHDPSSAQAATVSAPLPAGMTTNIPLAIFDSADVGHRDMRTELVLAGQTFELLATTAKRVPAVNARVLRGSLVGQPGRFVLTEVNGSVAGAIWTEDGSYDLRPIDGLGGVRIIDIDNADLPPCAVLDDAEPALLEIPGVDQGVALRGEPEQIVRVLVGITQAGQNQMGGVNGAIAVATAAVESTNSAYENSLMTVGDAGVVQCQLELVGTLTVNPGTGLDAGELLGALRSTSDGVMDELHDLRDVTGADLVALLSESGIGACGVAYLAPTNPTLGFSVTAQSCAVGNLTFAHELGHNFGASHDADNAGSGFRSYGFGWRWNTSSGSLRRSVMAYSPGSRRPNFSNPEVFNSGGATGNAQLADNARLIGETFPSVASFRTGGGSNIGDCDEDGTPDLIQLSESPILDSDSSGVLDSCELAEGLLEDCNNDGLADVGQVTPRIVLAPDAIQLVAFPPYKASVQSTVPAGSTVRVTIAADADLSGPNEYLDITINGMPLGRFWDTDGADCDPMTTTLVLEYTPTEWEGFGPEVDFEVFKSSAVGNACPTDAVTVTVEYTGTNPALDANRNGIIDSCEPGCGIADVAEPIGVLDLTDISTFVAAFTTQSPLADINADGVYDLSDISTFIAAFTAGCDG